MQFQSLAQFRSRISSILETLRDSAFRQINSSISKIVIIPNSMKFRGFILLCDSAFRGSRCAKTLCNCIGYSCLDKVPKDQPTNNTLQCDAIRSEQFLRRCRLGWRQHNIHDVKLFSFPVRLDQAVLKKLRRGSGRSRGDWRDEGRKGKEVNVRHIYFITG